MSLWLWRRNPKFNRGHLLVMTNHNTKLEDSWAMSSLVIDRTMFVNGPADRPTDRHLQSNIPPHLRRGHNNQNENWSKSANSIEPGKTAWMYRLAWLYTGDKGLLHSFQATEGLRFYRLMWQTFLTDHHVRNIVLPIKRQLILI